MSPGNQALLHLGLHPLSQKDIETKKSLGDFFISHAVKHREFPADSKAGNGSTRLPLDLYSVFLVEFQVIAISKPRSETEILKHFGIERAQARKWLQRALAEGRVEKLKPAGRVFWRPVP